MAKISLDGLDAMQYDVLKEIGNIGAGNATTALSKMLSIKMDMSVPNVALLPFQDISSVIGSEDQTVVGILLGIEGDIDGMMMFLFDMKSAHHLVNSLMMRDVTTDEDLGAESFTEIEMSALNEIGNIVSGSLFKCTFLPDKFKDDMYSTVTDRRYGRRTAECAGSRVW